MVYFYCYDDAVDGVDAFMKRNAVIVWREVQYMVKWSAVGSSFSSSKWLSVSVFMVGYLDSKCCRALTRRLLPHFPGERPTWRTE